MNLGLEFWDALFGKCKLRKSEKAKKIFSKNCFRYFIIFSNFFHLFEETDQHYLYNFQFCITRTLYGMFNIIKKIGLSPHVFISISKFQTKIDFFQGGPYRKPRDFQPKKGFLIKTFSISERAKHGLSPHVFISISEVLTKTDFF